jgi:hypothetical protein
MTNPNSWFLILLFCRFHVQRENAFLDALRRTLATQQNAERQKHSEGLEKTVIKGLYLISLKEP